MHNFIEYSKPNKLEENKKTAVWELMQVMMKFSKYSYSQIKTPSVHTNYDNFFLNCDICQSALLQAHQYDINNMNIVKAIIANCAVLNFNGMDFYDPDNKNKDGSFRIKKIFIPEDLLLKFIQTKNIFENKIKQYDPNYKTQEELDKETAEMESKKIRNQTITFTIFSIIIILTIFLLYYFKHR